MDKKIALSIHGLKVRYGAIEAVKGINIEVPEGSVVALLGANGAGKTSTLRTISGLTVYAIMNNLNAREAAHAEPVIIASKALVAGTNEVSIPVEKTRNTTSYYVQAMVTDGDPGTIVVTKRQANGFTVTAAATGTVTFVVMGGIL